MDLSSTKYLQFILPLGSRCLVYSTELYKVVWCIKQRKRDPLWAEQEPLYTPWQHMGHPEELWERSLETSAPTHPHVFIQATEKTGNVMYKRWVNLESRSQGKKKLCLAVNKDNMTNIICYFTVQNLSAPRSKYAWWWPRWSLHHLFRLAFLKHSITSQVGHRHN